MRTITTLLLLTVFISLLSSCTKESGKPGFSSAGTGGSLARFTISGDYLYIVDKTNLKTYDVSDGALPELKSTSEAGFEIETIYPFGDKLFIGSTSVVHIFSISDPANPKKLSEAISPQVLRRCDPVVAKDTVAYATLRTNGACGGTQSILAVYDIKNILQPVQVNSVPLWEPYGLGYSDHALYVCVKSGLLVFNISDPYHPQLQTEFGDDEYVDVIPYGNVLVCWVKNGVAIYDISDKLDPLLITKIR